MTALAVVATAGLMTVAVGSASASGATRYVATDGSDLIGETPNNCLDPNHKCRTIQHAVNEADAGDTVAIDGGLYEEGVDITKSLTLKGAGSTGAGRTTIDGPSDDTAPSVNVDGTDGSVEVTLKNLDISGNANADGIDLVQAVVHVLDSVVNNNAGSGIAVEVATSSGVRAQDAVVPTVTVSNSSINNNGQTNTDFGVGSGILLGAGAAHVDHSTINGNSAAGVLVGPAELDVDTTTLDHNYGAGVFALAFDGPGQVNLNKDTISNTVPFTEPELGDVFGVGLLTIGTGFTISNSTFSGNTSDGVLSASAGGEITNSTITGTKPGGSETDLPWAGIAVLNVESDAVTARIQSVTKKLVATKAIRQGAVVRPKLTLAGVTVTSTINADNTTVDDCNGPVNDGGYNLSSDDTCGFTDSTSIEDGHARLGPLADNGGPTLTHKPAKNSDAIDQIPANQAGCDAELTDQRGLPRLAGPKCDIGAVEVAQPAVVIAPNALPNGTVGTAYHQVVTATGGLGAPYEWSLAGGTLPPGLSLTSGGVISGTPTQAGTFHFTVSVDDPTLKAYTIVIDAAAALPTSTEQPLANTGSKVRPVAYLGATAVGLGLLMLAMSGALGRWYRRYIRQH